MVSNVNTTFDWPTNFFNGTSITGVGTMFQYAHYVTNGAFALGVLTLIFLMGLGVGLAVGVKRALASASFITLIFAVYFLRIGMVSQWLVFLLLGLTIIGALGAKAESGGI